MRVLVAQNDESLGEELRRALRRSGYVVDLVADGETALSYTRRYDYSVALLDRRIPRVPGIDVVRRLRRRGYQVPVLLMSGRDVPRERVAGLDAGADDYLTEPFDVEELLARLRALQRRPPGLLPPMLTVGDLECDLVSRVVRFAGKQLSLTATEMRILETLMRCSPAAAHRQWIAQQAWNDESHPLGSNTIDVHLGRLRAKLAGARARIETVRGVGYRIIPA